MACILLSICLHAHNLMVCVLVVYPGRTIPTIGDTTTRSSTRTDHCPRSDAYPNGPVATAPTRLSPLTWRQRRRHGSARPMAPLKAPPRPRIMRRRDPSPCTISAHPARQGPMWASVTGMRAAPRRHGGRGARRAYRPLRRPLGQRGHARRCAPAQRRIHPPHARADLLHPLRGRHPPRRRHRPAALTDAARTRRAHPSTGGVAGLSTRPPRPLTIVDDRRGPGAHDRPGCAERARSAAGSGSARAHAPRPRG